MYVQCAWGRQLVAEHGAGERQDHDVDAAGGLQKQSILKLSI